MENNSPLLAIVVPCYNEEEVLPETIKQLSCCLNDLVNDQLIHMDSKILFVDDGSRDRTWSIIARESIRNPLVTGIKLTRNVGHQNALLAGYLVAKEKCDCAISIDCDLQDDISVIRNFIEKYHQGYEIVYGVRDSRETDTWFKRTTALSFYRLMKKMGIHLVHNHADFRLLGKRALEELAKYEENNLFLRGIIPLLGFKATEVYYDRKERFAGKTKYPLKKMLSFAINGITSFSMMPIRIITFLGFVLFFISIFAGSYALIQKVLGFTSAGWTSLMISIWFIGGLQLVAIGIIGEYIGKIFMEVKKRPKFAIDIDLYTKPMLGEQSIKDEILVNLKHKKEG
ncbi:glycosyltransferase family 2 protein [Pallidibacillus thermolactis]|jgi:polyisoprenyl-phosphate glycosyltransferase|uniref:glycosyltransferase family 2 protein n=1 Tax=Pallidibacillus thermolactis TaxID=251051 RepID=UPI0021DA5C62|nr:glycosyltransferase family 2 protein [Pallidibacillus thermolactis]MCU9602256.1 glycosyltransferase family 2 protein [Pallidibacillus thermolactis subsp. kokeshiiformis]